MKIKILFAVFILGCLLFSEYMFRNFEGFLYERESITSINKDLISSTLEVQNSCKANSLGNEEIKKLYHFSSLINSGTRNNITEKINVSSQKYKYNSSSGTCRDLSGNLVPINYCYVNSDYAIGLGNCVDQGAICYYDSYWNLVDAFPSQCKQYCAN